jgi:hypothetical protein
MTIKLFDLSILSLIALMPSWAQDVPPPPKPPEGPSLEVTMKFIEDKLGSIGPVNYVIYGHDNTDGSDWTHKVSTKQTSLRAGMQGCRIDFHFWLKTDEEVTIDQDSGILFKDVQEVVVKTREQAMKEVDAKNGHPEWSSRVDPPVFVLLAKWRNGQTYFLLNDESLAHRLAKAMVHAVELCGGGSKDPF